MNLFRPLSFLISFPFLLFASCHEGSSEQKQQQAVDSIQVDSNALVLSLTPTVECLPLYYAQESGIFKTLGLKVRLETCASQFDCDTAMLGTTAIGGVSDLVRLHYYAHQGKRMTAVTALDGKWKLMVSGALRIKKTQLLKDRMIAVARFSTSDIYSKEAVEKVGLEYNEVFRPQINSYFLRTSMLNNNQVDAAVLPEPFATRAKLAGHREVYRSDEHSGRFGCLLFKPSLLLDNDSAEYVKTILLGYNKAVKEINQKGKGACGKIFSNVYGLSSVEMDSLVLPKYLPAAMPSMTDVQNSRDFLEKANRWNVRINTESLLNSAFLPE